MLLRTAALAPRSNKLAPFFSYCEARFACFICMHMYRLHIDYAYLECKLAF